MIRQPNQPRVVVTGIGMVTALGSTMAETWEAVIAGRSGVAALTRFDPGDLPEPVRIAAEVKNFSPDGVLDEQVDSPRLLPVQHAVR